MRKLIKVAAASALAVIAVATSALPAFAASTTLEGRHKIGDLYFGVSKNGLSIANKNADHLLYGKKNGGTSKAFMSVDDNDAAQPLFAVPDISPSKSTVTYTATYKNVEGTLVWKVIPNSVTHAKDVVEITLTMKNVDTKSHKVGGRINVDTMLGDNDGAPFRIGSKAVTAPVVYEGNKIPAVFQTVDSLSNPQIVTNGRFGVGAYAPDKVQFNDWWKTADGVLNPKLAESMGDTSVTAIKNIKTLAPNASMSVSMYYGLGTMDVTSEAGLNLSGSVTANEFKVNADGTGYEPINVMGYLKNVGVSDLSNPVIKLNVSSDVNLGVGESAEVKYSDGLAVNAEKQAVWTLSPKPSSLSRTITAVLSASSRETGEVKPFVYKFVVPAIAGAEAIATPDEVTPVATEPVTVPSTTGSVTETTTVPDPDNVDATSSFEKIATKDSATADSAKKYIPHDSANTVQTGQVIIGSVLFVLIAGLGVLLAYYLKVRHDSKSSK